MSVDRAVRIVALLLPLLAFLAPLVYGFGEYGWDVPSFVVPRYKAPKIGVDLRFRSLSVSDSEFMLIFQANNTGEVDLRILSFDGVVYASSGEEVGELSLVHEVDLPKASSGDLVLELKSREIALAGLVSKLISGGRVSLSVKGIAQVEVLGAVAEVPVSKSFEVDVGKSVNAL